MAARVGDGAVGGAEPEAVGEAGAAQALQPEVDGVAPGQGDRELVGDAELLHRVAGVARGVPVAGVGVAEPGPVGAPGALDEERVAGVVEQAEGVQVVEVDLDGDEDAVRLGGGRRVGERGGGHGRSPGGRGVVEERPGTQREPPRRMTEKRLTRGGDGRRAAATAGVLRPPP